MKKKINSKEWLTTSIFIFLGILIFMAGLGIDTNHTVLAKKNIFEGIAKLFNIQLMPATSNCFIMLMVVSIFIVLIPIAILLIKRSLIERNESTKSAKAYLFYISSVVLILAIGFAIALLFQLPNDGLLNLPIAIQYTLSSMFIGTFMLVVLGSFIWAIAGVIYFLFMNKKEVRDEAIVSEDINKNNDRNDDLTKSFTSKADSINASIQAQGAQSGGVIGNRTLREKDFVFQNLVAIDNDNTFLQTEDFSDDITLNDLVDNLQGYLATKEELYYQKSTLTAFIAGLAASKFIILEGVSGTGKTSLPRYFSKFISEDAYFEPIQVTYREKGDLLGYYNELTGKYNETSFLKRLYRKGYEANSINLMVLDEMNISRIEYYFADFLSVMEFPEDKRYINLISLPSDYNGPLNLIDGSLLITPNTYFIGTANKDDSTFTITDKVIDRAIVINFTESNKKLSFDKEYNPISLSYNELNNLFIKAKKKNIIPEDENIKLMRILDLIKEELDIVTGNRILKQINDMCPIYMECGYTPSMCYDMVISNKILRKLDGKYNQSLLAGLNNLTKLINSLYSNDEFIQTKRTILKIIRRLS